VLVHHAAALPAQPFTV